MREVKEVASVFAVLAALTAGIIVSLPDSVLESTTVTTIRDVANRVGIDYDD